MKKTFYIVCICCLGILIVHELRINFARQETSSKVYKPSARFLMQIKDENEKVGKKVAYLTFDDGPSETTPEILDILKQKKVKATFFLIGEEITEKRKAIVKREIKEGHGVGIHTQCHVQKEIYRNKEAFMKDFMQAYQKIFTTTGMYPELHRFPWGSMNGCLKTFFPKVKSELEEMGIRSYDWNCSGEDSVGSPSVGSILQNVKKDYAKFDSPIILLHDSNQTKETVKALGEIIDMIRSDGYKFDTLSHRGGSYLFPQEWRKS